MCSRVLGIGGLNVEGSLRSLCSNAVSVSDSDRNGFSRIIDQLIELAAHKLSFAGAQY